MTDDGISTLLPVLYDAITSANSKQASTLIAAQAGLFIYVDCKTPQDSEAATLCLMGAPEGLPAENLRIAKRANSLIAAIEGDTALPKGTLDEAIAALQVVREFIDGLDFAVFADVSDAAVGYRDLFPHLNERFPSLNAVLSRIPLDELPNVKQGILDALDSVLERAADLRPRLGGVDNLPLIDK